MKFLKTTILFVSIVAVSCSLIWAQETGGVKGKVFNERKRGIPQVVVEAHQDGKNIKTISTDKNGKFVLDGLKTGRYNFVFSKSGFNSGTLNNVEINGKEIRDLGNRLLEIDEGTLTLIKGSVFNQNGRSLYGAKVQIERISGDGAAKKLNTDYTSESGEFTFRFPQGTAKYRVTVFAKGKSASKEVAVDGAAIYRIALTLDLSGEK